MINEYIFDYRLVLEEDLSFEKFVDVRDTVDNLEERYNERYYTDQINNTRKENNSESENDIIDFVHDKENIDVGLNETDAWINTLRDNNDNKNIREVNLKPEYVDAPNPNYNYSIPQLLPPNRFLLPGSRTWQGEHTFYIFAGSGNNTYDNNKYICLIQKYRFSKKDHFIRLQKAVYRFDRKRNVTSEMKKYLSIWTYNTKTKQLYLIRKVKSNRLKKGSHFHSKINNVFNTLPRTNWNGSMPESISNKFLKEILKAAIKDVPDLVILNKDYLQSDFHDKPKGLFKHKYQDKQFQSMSLAAIILQHRVGKPMKWLNYNLMQNIWDILGEKQFQELSLDGANDFYNRDKPKEREKRAKALRRKTIFKLVPNLKKNNHMNTAIKTIVGEHCNKFIIRLFNIGHIDIQFLHNWIYATRKGMISKNLYHFISNIINIDHTKEDISYLLNHITAMLVHILYNFHAETNNFDKDSYYLIIDSYLKTYKRIKSDDDDRFPTWHIWYDMYNMASQLGIRIRSNKLESSGDIQNLHNRLSNIIRRDRITVKKYRNSIFDKFKSPDKKYNGFEFIQMRTAENLVEEGTAMKHCIASYANKCAEGNSIIFSMRKDGKGYVTIELSPTSYKIIQQYTIQDYTVTNQKILDIIDKWNNDCIELHKNDKESYYSICRKGIQAKSDKENAQNIKELVKEGIIDAEEKMLKSMMPCNRTLPINKDLLDGAII